MSVLLGSIVPGVIAMVLATIVLRMSRGRRPYLLLLVCCIAAFIGWHTLNSTLLLWQAAHPKGWEAWIAVALLYATGIQFVLGNYTCIGQDSPSMTVVALLHDAGTEGRSRDELVSDFRACGHLEQRVENTGTTGLLKRNQDGSFSATAAGRMTRRGFDFCAIIMGWEDVRHD